MKATIVRISSRSKPGRLRCGFGPFGGYWVARCAVRRADPRCVAADRPLRVLLGKPLGRRPSGRFSRDESVPGKSMAAEQRPAKPFVETVCEIYISVLYHADRFPQDHSAAKF